MKKVVVILVLLLSVVVFSQEKTEVLLSKKNTVLQKNEVEFFTQKDLALIDSLLIDAQLNSPLTQDFDKYLLDDAENLNVIDLELNDTLLKERLSNLDDTTPFHITYNPALEKIIKSYLKYRKKYYPNLLARAAYYFPMFEKYLDHFDIPLEMKYLAIVESALKPRAKSRVGATGLWQFMYATGRQYNLKISSYVDEREDPVKSTIAACKYLNTLYNIFGDWNMALAAYNSGPGNVTKAIRRSGGYKNYWNIRPFLPKETAGYVPAFYATMYIFNYAKEHGIIANTPVIREFETDTIRVKRTVSFDQITEIIGVNTDVLEFLNPSYKLDIIPFIKDRNYTVKLPKRYIGTFVEKEEELYALANQDDARREKPLPQYFEMDKRIRYKVRNGDYLGKIANKFGVRVSDIKRWNALKSNSIRVGQRLYIYPKKLKLTKSELKSISSKSSNLIRITIKKEILLG